MNNPPVPPNVPPIHTVRRQNEYQYPPIHHVPAHHHPYASQHHPYAPPPPPYYQQQWYPSFYAPPAGQYAPVHQRQFQQQHQQQPLVVSSYPHAQPVLPLSRQPITTPQPIPTPQPAPTPQPVQTPQQDQSTTPSTTSQPLLSPATTATTSVNESTPPASTPKETQNPLVLPWLSVPESEFPEKPLRRRRKKKAAASSNLLELPQQQQSVEKIPDTPKPPSEPPSEPESPSEPTTPAPAPSHKRNATKPIIPVIPIVSNITSPPQKSGTPPAEPAESVSEVASLPERPAPKSWAELLRTKTPNTGSGAAVVEAPLNGAPNSLAETLRSYSINHESKIAFLEPRGLVNTGNMCYMNSILQVLVFCVPFYDFLDQVGKRAVHSFKSDTPLLEAMIMFMREFPVIDSAMSVERLRMRIKDSEIEQYGESLIPEYVYDVIKRLPRFSTMRRGHQQDAEEFLGFLLEGLHDECVHVLQRLTGETPSERSTEASPDGGWLEVGPKQKPSVTRSSGAVVTESPLTKIFGGKLRSELRVPGLKNSVTLEPYQPLQLDIGLPGVNNITDALRGLTRSETLQGDFNSPRGPGTSATKQVFIETLPPVLILHLKRFQYDNSGGTQKIWKKIGYPLELEIPKEVFPPSKRGVYSTRPAGLPKYKLISVVYHHGKNASGGHYTVDVRRQEGREWIRLDDTSIKRARSEDVALEGRTEESSKSVPPAPDNGASKNMYDLDETSSEKEWSQVNGSPTSGHAKKWSNSVEASQNDSRTSVKDNKVAYILFYQQL